MENEKNLINEKDENKISGGSLKYTDTEGIFNVSGTDKDGNKITGNIKVKGSLAAPYCDACGKELEDKKSFIFMYDGTVHHMCESCHNSGCMSIFKKS